MKILVVYQYFGTPKGSWSTRMYELCRRWVAEGHQVEVITAPYDKSDLKAEGFINKLQIDGIDIRVVNSGDSNRFNFIKRALRASLFALVSLYYALTLKFDVLIASSGPITIGLPMIFAKRLRKKVCIFEVRDLWPQGAIELGKIFNTTVISLARRFEKTCYSTADAVIAASPGMKAGVERSYKNTPVWVIPNASDLEVFNIPQTIPDHFPDSLQSNKIVLYAGSLGFMDECETAIRAMKDLIGQKIALVFLGDGNERKELEKLAQITGNPNIHFLGLLPKTEVAKWYSIASASLVGFKNFEVLGTSSPNKMFDSFAAGVPIIQNTNGWIAELVEQYQCGFNVQYGSVEDYHAVFETVLKEPELIRKYGENAMKLAKGIFNRDVLAKEYLGYMEQLVMSS